MRVRLSDPHGHLRGKSGAACKAIPPSVLGGMQIFLYNTIAVAGLRVLIFVRYTRRNRFILTIALNIGFINVAQPDWWDNISTYPGTNVALSGFKQGVNLIIQTPFIIAAILGIFLNLVLPEDTNQMDDMLRDQNGQAILDKKHQPNRYNMQ